MELTFSYDPSTLKNREDALYVTQEAVRSVTEALLLEMHSQNLLVTDTAPEDCAVGFGRMISRTIAFQWRDKKPMGS